MHNKAGAAHQLIAFCKKSAGVRVNSDHFDAGAHPYLPNDPAAQPLG